MENEAIGVVTFYSSQHALQAENTLTRRNFHVKLIPGPKDISPNCGVALQFDRNLKEEVEIALNSESVLFESVQLYTLTNEKSKLKKLLGF